MRIPKTAKPCNRIAEFDEVEKYCVQEDTSAWYIREIYAQCRTSFDNFRFGREKDYRVPRRYDGLLPTREGRKTVAPGVVSVWLKLDEFFTANSLEPMGYILFQFSNTDPGKMAPEPLQLISGPRLENWYKYQESLPALLAAKLRAEHQEFLSTVTYHETFGKRSKVDACLLSIANRDTTLSPLYRYCRAWQLLKCSGDIRFSQIIGVLEREASAQFSSHPEIYRSQWGDVIPPGLEFASR